MTLDNVSQSHATDCIDISLLLMQKEGGLKVKRMIAHLWLVLLCGIALASTTWAQQQTSVRITTGGTTGSFFPQGAGVAEYLNSHSSFLRAIPSTSGGGVENVRRLAVKEAEFGLAYPGDLIQAWYAEPPFREKIENVRMVGPGQSATLMHVFVLENSGITSLEELGGKKFVTGAPGSTAAQRCDLFFKTVGLFDKIQISYMSWRELPDRLKNGTIQGYCRSGTPPISDITQISVTHKVRVLDLGPAMDRSGLLTKYPFMYKSSIPANTYAGQAQELTTFAEPIVWVTHKDVPDTVVAEFLSLAFTEAAAKQLDAAYKGHAHRDLSMMAKVRSVPLHPAAARFWKDKGIQVAEPAVK